MLGSSCLAFFFVCVCVYLFASWVLLSARVVVYLSFFHLSAFLVLSLYSLVCLACNLLVLAVCLGVNCLPYCVALASLVSGPGFKVRHMRGAAHAEAAAEAGGARGDPPASDLVRSPVGRGKPMGQVPLLPFADITMQGCGKWNPLL